MFLLDLLRRVAGVLQPAHGGTGSTHGEDRVVVHGLNSTGATLALYTLVQYTFGSNDGRVKKVAATASTLVLGVVVGYFDGDGQLVEAGCPDGYEAAVQTSGRVRVLVEAAVTRGEYAFAAATDGQITSSSTAGAGAFGVVVTSADPAEGHTYADVQLPLTAFLGAGSTPAPVDATYLVTAAHADLSAEVVVGATPGGELGGTWAAPTVDATHSGSAHHAEGHDHDGSPTQKLAQANTHESPDTDTADGALHHTLGVASNNAAKGNHSHGSSGTSIAIYIPEAPPASAHANDDEFADSSVGGAWTEWDHGAILTPAEGTRGLTHTPTAAGIDKWCGVYRGLPVAAGSGDWAIVTKVTLSSDIPATGDFIEAGLVLLQDGASSTADHYGWSLQNTTAAAFRRGIALTNWSAYNVFNVSTVAMEADGLTVMSHVYLRIRRVGTTYLYDWSTDGDGWLNAFSHTPAFTVQHVGLGVWKGTDRNVSAMFRFWRQTADTSLYARLDGQVLTL